MSWISRLVQARPVRLFKTKSKRIRGAGPKTVAFRIETTTKELDANLLSASSECCLHLEYSVSGLVADDSSQSWLPVEPYTEHDEKLMKRLTPASRAALTVRIIP